MATIAFKIASRAASNPRIAPSSEPLHFLQIWVVPDHTALTPGYEQKAFLSTRGGGKCGSLPLPMAGMAQSACIRMHAFSSPISAPVSAPITRLSLVAVYGCNSARGIIALNGTEMREGYGAAVEDEPAIEIEAETDVEFLVFDVA